MIPLRCGSLSPRAPHGRQALVKQLYLWRIQFLSEICKPYSFRPWSATNKPTESGRTQPTFKASDPMGARRPRLRSARPPA
eukprot:8913293-Pyramimonas_sp.AAC.1